MYQEAGLEGLLSGGINKMELLPLLNKFTNIKYAKFNPHKFHKLLRFYTTEDSSVLDQLITLIVKIQHLPFKKRNYSNSPDSDTLYQKANDMMTAAINSFQGLALDVLLSMCSIKNRRPQIYQLLISIHDILPEELRIQVLHYIYVNDYYDSELFDKLLPIYLSKLDTIALAVRADAIQSYFYFKRDIVSPFIDRVMIDKDSHEILAQIFFYGTYHSEIHAVCIENLEKILILEDEHVISKMIEVSFKHVSDTAFSDLAKGILIRFAGNDNEKIRQSYQLYCDELPIDCFDLFLLISKNWKHDTNREIHEIMRYLEKCIGQYPIECYRYIMEQNFWNMQDFIFIEKDIINILLEIYKKLKESDDLDSMNELMDLFDKYILTSNKTINEALLKMES